MDNVQGLLWMCVKEWDRLNKDGAAPSESLMRVCAERGLEIEISMDDEACATSALGHRLASVGQKAAPSQSSKDAAAPSQARQFGALITGIPKGGKRQQQLGDTFLLLRLPDRVVVVDSHRHVGQQSSEPGTVIAESKTVGEMVKWMSEVLLKEMSCALDFVQVTAFTLKTARLHGNMTLADFARQASGQAPQPKTKRSAAVEAASRGEVAEGASRGSKATPSSADGSAAHSQSRATRSQGSGGAGIQALECNASSMARHTCTKFSAKCAECQWDKHGKFWQGLDTVAFIDASGHKVTPIVSRPEHLGGAWAIGCAVCAKAKNTLAVPRQLFQAWAKFEVRDLESMKKQSVERHCRSEHHKEAVRMARQSTPAPSQLPAGFSGSPHAPEPALDGVPRADRFVWAIQNVARGGSFRDYEKWIETNDLTSQLTSEGVTRDSSRSAAEKMIFCVAAVTVEERQQLLRRALRLSFAVDDRDQVFVMRARVSFVRPRVGSEDFFVGLVRDYGYSTEDSARAIYECLRSLCTVRRGRRKATSAPGGSGTQPRTSGSQPEKTSGSQPEESSHMVGPDDYVDEELLAHVVKITIAGASDGCPVALKAVQEVRRLHLTNLRYQFRDRPHTTRTCQKGVLKYMNEGQALMSALISGKGSFAKRAKHSRRFQQIWLRKQLEAMAAARRSGSRPGSQPDLFVALANLAHAEHRFDSRSEPMSIMCSRFGVIVEVLLEIADDEAPSHRADRAWALELLNLISGVEGWKRLLIFGMDCDFAVATQILVRVQDGISPDVALTAAQVAETLEVVEALFREGQVLLPEAEGMYTSQLLRGLRQVRLAARRRLKWPECGSGDFDLSGPRAYGKTLFKMMREFFRLNFPDYDWRRKFGAFNCGNNCFPTEMRLQFIGQLAAKERVNPHEARSQFLSALPHMKRLYEETGDNREAWCAYVQILQRHHGQLQAAVCGSQPGKTKTLKQTHGALLTIILTYIALLDCTSDVERMFACLASQEAKSRERHMAPVVLSAVLTVAVAVPSNTDSLVVRVTDAARSQLWWKPKPFLLKAMRKYAEFFGTRSFASRSTVMQSGLARAAQKPRMRIGTPRAAKHVTKKAMKERWCEAAKTLVQSWRKKKQTSAPSQVIIDNQKLSEESQSLHKAVFSAQARTQNIEKRKFVKMEAKTGLAAPVAPLQGLPRKRKPCAIAAKGVVAKTPRKKRSSKTAALSQSLSPKWAQKVRQVLQARAAAKTAPVAAAKSALGATVPSSAPVSLFRLARAVAV